MDLDRSASDVENVDPNDDSGSSDLGTETNLGTEDEFDLANDWDDDIDLYDLVDGAAGVEEEEIEQVDDLGEGTSGQGGLAAQGQPGPKKRGRRKFQKDRPEVKDELAAQGRSRGAPRKPRKQAGRKKSADPGIRARQAQRRARRALATNVSIAFHPRSTSQPSQWTLSARPHSTQQLFVLLSTSKTAPQSPKKRTRKAKAPAASASEAVQRLWTDGAAWTPEATAAIVAEAEREAEAEEYGDCDLGAEELAALERIEQGALIVAPRLADADYGVSGVFPSSSSASDRRGQRPVVVLPARSLWSDAARSGPAPASFRPSSLPQLPLPIPRPFLAQPVRELDPGDAATPSDNPKQPFRPDTPSAAADVVDRGGRDIEGKAIRSDGGGGTTMPVKTRSGADAGAKESRTNGDAGVEAGAGEGGGEGMTEAIRRLERRRAAVEATKGVVEGPSSVRSLIPALADRPCSVQRACIRLQDRVPTVTLPKIPPTIPTATATLTTKTRRTRSRHAKTARVRRVRGRGRHRLPHRTIRRTSTPFARVSEGSSRARKRRIGFSVGTDGTRRRMAT